MDVEWGFKALPDQLCMLNAIWASEHVSSRLKILLVVLEKKWDFCNFDNKKYGRDPMIYEKCVYCTWKMKFFAHPACVPIFIQIENWISIKKS